MQGSEASIQGLHADVIKRNSYATEDDRILATKWSVVPGLVHVRRGDTVHWKVYDADHRDIRLRDPNGVFEAGSFNQSGNNASARVSSSVQQGRYYEYRFFWGSDEAQGGSAPGVIID
jgi:hypothetical protein